MCARCEQANERDNAHEILAIQLQCVLDDLTGRTTVAQYEHGHSGGLTSIACERERLQKFQLKTFLRLPFRLAGDD